MSEPRPDRLVVARATALTIILGLLFWTLALIGIREVLSWTMVAFHG